MNYLAHAYLSFNHPQVLAGNIISDYVKGKTRYDYPQEVQAGIMLHRAIDHFTDTHPATKNAISLFKPKYRLYAGAFVDIAYDYFLANDRQQFAHADALMAFSQQTYIDLDRYSALFPPKFKLMFPHMKAQNWLYHYQFNEGIQNSFKGLVRRASYLPECDIAYDLFLNNKDFLQVHYDEFFYSVKTFAAHTMQDLLKS